MTGTPQQPEHKSGNQLLEWQADRIEAVFGSKKVVARVVGGTVTPRWIRFEVIPAVGQNIDAIRRLDKEICAATDTQACRISQKGAAVTIEVTRTEAYGEVTMLGLYKQLTSPDREGKPPKPIPPIAAILGLAEDGAPMMIRLPSPDVAHVLIAGTTGSGKTVLQCGMILSLAMANSPTRLAMILIDPKGHAFTNLADLPHLARPIVTTTEEAIEALRSTTRLMDHLGQYRTDRPRIAIFIDEFGDLLMTGGKPIQDAMTRLTQRGREAGIHIVAATQKPTVPLMGSLNKANFPVRICGRVTSIEDARTATGWSGTGAERLLGRGDMVIVAMGQLTRFQAGNVSQADAAKIVARTAEHWHTHTQGAAPPELPRIVRVMRETFARVTSPSKDKDGNGKRDWTIAQQAMIDACATDGPLDLEALAHSDTIGAELAAARTEAEREAARRAAPQSAVIPPAPPEPPKDTEEVTMAKRLHKMGWNPEQSIRATCRILGEPEGGVRFLTVKDALVVLRAMYEQDSAAILARLREMEWDIDRPYLDAVKALGMTEKGYWLTLVQSAVVLLQQDALQEAQAIEADLEPEPTQEPAPASKPAMAPIEVEEGWTVMQKALHWHPQGTQEHKDPGKAEQGDASAIATASASATEPTTPHVPEIPHEGDSQPSRSRTVAESQQPDPRPNVLLTPHPADVDPHADADSPDLGPLARKLLQGMALTIRESLMTSEMMAIGLRSQLNYDDLAYIDDVTATLARAQQAMIDELAGIAAHQVGQSVKAIIIGGKT